MQQQQQPWRDAHTPPHSQLHPFSLTQTQTPTATPHAFPVYSISLPRLHLHLHQLSSTLSLSSAPTPCFALSPPPFPSSLRLWKTRSSSSKSRILLLSLLSRTRRFSMASISKSMKERCMQSWGRMVLGKVHSQRFLLVTQGPRLRSYWRFCDFQRSKLP